MDFSKINDIIDDKVQNSASMDSEVKYLSTMAPNIVEWVTGVEYWGVPSTYKFSRQYQILRDFFNLRCKNETCNIQTPEAIDCWGKPRSYLESETLLVWSESDQDFKCPKCGNTLRGFIVDGVVMPYNELLTIAGMRSGKSFLGAHIGGYINHVLCAMSMKGKHTIQRFLRQEKSEWFEVTFAASTATQAQHTIYAKFREMRNNSPWMNRYVAWVKKKEAQQVGVKDNWEYKSLDADIFDGWQQVRYNRVSSNSGGVAGRTRILGAIDELSRLSVTESKTSAAELYRVINQSLKTVRSACDNYGLFPYFGLMLNVTSPISLDDYAMNLYAKLITQGSAIKRTFYWKGPTWEFNPEQKRENFDDEFAKDPIAAQRDFGADPPAAETPLIDDLKRFWKSIDFEREPIAKFETTYITDATDKKYVGARLLDLNYNFSDIHYIFCDAAETFDSFAMVCAHPVILDGSSYQEEMNFENKNRIVLPESGMHITNLPSSPNSPLAQGYRDLRSVRRDPTKLGRLVTYYDFCMRIVPTKERDIWFNSILEIVKELKKKIKIGAVCFDRWQSTAAIQAIRDMGIQSFSVTLKSNHFLEFKSQAYNNQVSMLPPLKSDALMVTDAGTPLIGQDELLMSGQGVGLLEMIRLERSPDLVKVLAPKKGMVRGKGSDDVARCMVGANVMVKDSVVNNLDNVGRKREIQKRLKASGNTNPVKLFNARF